MISHQVEASHVVVAVVFYADKLAVISQQVVVVFFADEEVV